MPTAAATPCKPGPENMPTTSGDWLGSGDPSGGISQKRMREGELGALLGGTVPDGGLKVTCSGWGFKHTPTHESRGQPRVPPTERAARLRSSPRFTRHDSVSHPSPTGPQYTPFHRGSYTASSSFHGPFLKGCWCQHPMTALQGKSRDQNMFPK